MGANTKIQWCDFTFNPWWGCQRVSPGCEHCYAETFAKRVGQKVWGPTSDRRLFGDKHWAEPLKWAATARKDGTRPRVFCASMADVFEDRRDLDDQRVRLWALIEATPELDWLLLTKRPENHKMVPLTWRDGSARPGNLWLGTTCEGGDEKLTDTRVRHLLSAPWPSIRFISAEPLLGRGYLDRALLVCAHWKGEDGRKQAPWEPEDFTKVWWEPQALRGIGQKTVDWVIVGGESGPGARPFDIRWAREIVAQCKAAKIPVFVKQLGSAPLIEMGVQELPLHRTRFWRDGLAQRMVYDLNDHKGGDINEFPEALRVREFPR